MSEDDERKNIRDGDDALRQLGELLRASGARPTIDSRRNMNDPCWRCRTVKLPRALVEIGKYTRPVGGNIFPGDRIMRPLCKPCEDETTPAIDDKNPRADLPPGQRRAGVPRRRSATRRQP